MCDIAIVFGLLASGINLVTALINKITAPCREPIPPIPDPTPPPPPRPAPLIKSEVRLETEKCWCSCKFMKCAPPPSPKKGRESEDPEGP